MAPRPMVTLGIIIARLWPGTTAAKDNAAYKPTKAYVTQGPRTTRQTLTTTTSFLPPVQTAARPPENGRAKSNRGSMTTWPLRSDA